MKTKSILLMVVVLLAVLLACTSCSVIAEYLLGMNQHEHSWTEATCTSPKTCATCNEIEGEPLGHIEEIIPGKDATCLEAGLTEGKKCSVCGEILVEQQQIPAKSHTEETIPGKASSCTETGLTEGKRCSDCGVILVEQQELPLAEHTEQIVPGKEATCTDNGLTDGKKCSVCGETIVAREEISPIPHTEEIIPGKAPSCTETGLTEGKKCSVCDKILVAQDVLAVEHKEETVAGKEATCTETGLTEGKKCSLCGVILLEQKEISSLGHKDENKDFECDVCNANLCTSHTPAEPIVENKKEASCSTEGSYDSVIKCSVCGEEISRETKVIDKLAHTEEEIAGKDATCSSTGLTAGKKCSVCGEILVNQEEIGKLPHTEEEIAGKDATCSSTGLTAGKKCSACGEILVNQEEIGKLPHTEELIDAKAPGCVATGLTEGKKCSVCGEILVNQEMVPATGHKWNGGNTVLNVTTYECETCGVKKAESTNLENKENIFAEKTFVGTDAANGQVLSAGWWQGGGYAVLTDGIMGEGVGRFSTVMNNTTAFMDATIDMGEKYVLGTMRFYLYDTKSSITEAAKKASIGKDILIQVYVDGQWYDVVCCANNAELCTRLVINDGVNDDYLEFDLSGIVAEKIRFYISASASTSGITYQEIECSGALLNEHVHTETVLPAKDATCLQAGVTEGIVCHVCNTVLKEQQVIDVLGHAWGDGATADGTTTHTCERCGVVKAENENLESKDNLFAGKQFVPADSALSSILTASWWKGSGYPGLTDGIKNADNAPGRFATIMNVSGLIDATIDLQGEAVLGILKIFTYDPATTNAGSLGADLLIQVYVGEKWIDVVYCADNAAILSHLVASEGAYNDYLEFDLSGILAEKVRVFISASASSSGTSFEEFECSGRVFPSEEPDAPAEPEPVYIDNLLAGKTLTTDTPNNCYSATYGFDKMNDGNLASRYSSKSKAGRVDATIDLGKEYTLDTFSFLLYDYNKSSFNQFGTAVEIQAFVNGEWVTVSNVEAKDFTVVVIGDQNWLTFKLDGVKATQVRFIIPSHGSAGWTTFWEVKCSGYEIN